MKKYEILYGNYNPNFLNKNHFINFCKENLFLLLKQKNFSGDFFVPNPSAHTDNIEIINDEKSLIFWKKVFSKDGINIYTKDYVDGVIIYKNIKNKGIGFFPGDCPIIYIRHQDENFEYMSLLHCGRRGIAKDILGKALEKTKEIIHKKDFQKLILETSPFAKCCCYDFDSKDFVDAFLFGIVKEVNGNDFYYNPLINTYDSVQIKKSLKMYNDGKYKLDLGNIIKSIGKKHKISEKNIKINEICTICTGDEEGLHSSRKNKNDKKRFGVLLYDNGD